MSDPDETRNWSCHVGCTPESGSKIRGIGVAPNEPQRVGNVPRRVIQGPKLGASNHALRTHRRRVGDFGGGTFAYQLKPEEAGPNQCTAFAPIAAKKVTNQSFSSTTALPRDRTNISVQLARLHLNLASGNRGRAEPCHPGLRGACESRGL